MTKRPASKKKRRAKPIPQKHFYKISSVRVIRSDEVKDK